MGSVPIFGIAISIHSIEMNRNRSRLGSTIVDVNGPLALCFLLNRSAWNPSLMNGIPAGFVSTVRTLHSFHRALIGDISTVK